MKRILLALGIVGLAACSDATTPTQIASTAPKPVATFLSGNNTVVVSPTNVDGWVFYNDETDVIDMSLGSFVAGPGTPTYGTGSAQISVTGSQRRNLATYQFAGIALSNITVLKFRTYNPSAGNPGSANRSAYLQFNIDFDGSDTWQRRITFVPSQNGTVTQNSWKEWDAINGGTALWNYSGANWPSTGEPGSTLKTWNQILADYPSARIRPTDGQLSLRVGEPYNDGYTENIDSFTFGTAAGTTVYDFEPSASLGSCSVSITGTTITLLSNCVTDRTLSIPQGFTLNGNGKTITAVNPASGSFLGAVITAAGTLANVNNVTIATSNLTGCQDGQTLAGLRGILFNGAGGSITNNTIRDINRGPSGCQEGNAIDITNVGGLSTLTAIVTGNTVTNYQKTGIRANGNVAATINNNVVTGLGPVSYIAQNGIQISRTATATMKNNTVSGNWYLGPDWVSCGVLFYQAGGVKASANNVFSNQVNQCNAGKGGGKFNSN